MDAHKGAISATISGSFSKHLNEIHEKIREFREAGIEVLSPEISHPIPSRDSFVMLETDHGSPKEIEMKHLDAISRSDFLYVVNPEGYIGKSAALEIGFAVSRNTPVYSSHKPEDIVLSFLVRSEKPIKTIKRELEAKAFSEKPLTLLELQDHVRRMVRLRGFDKERIEDALLLLTEEIGELARAIRNFVGLKTSHKPSNIYEHLCGELADCLIYLLDIANLAKIDLEIAFRKKMKRNSKRKWR
jgi:NTP pyrophosphatase (non-canonical NTP hydrolase)